jgi:hypothetical protein
VDAWLAAAAEAVAAAAGVPPGELALSDEEAATLLDLARVAAHEGGERRNAPLLCYLVGLAAGRTGRGVDALAGAVPRA